MTTGRRMAGGLAVVLIAVIATVVYQLSTSDTPQPTARASSEIAAAERSSDAGVSETSTAVASTGDPRAPVDRSITRVSPFADAGVSVTPLPVRVAPTPPALALERAEGMEQMLAQQIELVTRQLEETRASNAPPARIANLERLIREMRAQQPAARARVEELRRNL